MCTYIRKSSHFGNIRHAMLLLLTVVLVAVFAPGSAMATATNYYVDPNASTDGDGAMATPWNSLHSAVTWLNANGSGEIVLNLLAGVYSTDDGHEPDTVLTVEDNGGAITSLHILGDDPSTTLFEGYYGSTWLDAIIVTGDNITVEALGIAGYASGRGVYFNGASNGSVVNCTFSANLVGVEFAGCTNGSVTGDCVMTFNTSAGIILNQSTYCEISGNASSGGINNNGDGLSPYGIKITGASGGGHSIHDNWIPAGGDGYQIHQIYIQGSSIQDQIYNNIIQDSYSLDTYGVTIVDASPAIYKNIIKGCYYGVSCSTSAAGMEASPAVTNNLIYAAYSTDMYSGIYFNGENGGTLNPVIYHNTIATGSGSGVEFSNFAGTADVQYNILAYFSSYYGIVLNSGAGTIYADYNITYDVSNSFYGFIEQSNNMYGYPSFKDYAGEDFSLANGSPCIDFIPAGSGDPVNEDIDGTARPQNAGFDVGAYEYVTPPPTKLYVAPYVPEGGDGSEANPWNTLYTALTEINTNSSISGSVELHLEAGAYTVTGNGGIEPDDGHYVSGGYFDDLTIIGAGPDSTLISGVGAGYWTNGIQIQTSNVTVKNLTVENFSGAGLKFESAYYGGVKSCALKDNAYGVEISGGQDHWIHDCDIYNNSIRGVSVSYSGLVDIYQNRIYDNGGAAAAGYGVWAGYNSYGACTIAENQIYYTGDASHQQFTGIFNGFSTSYVDIITQNVISSTVETGETVGIHISNASPDVDGNQIFDCTTGILVENPEGSTTEPLITNNVIAKLTSGSYSLYHGIQLDGSNGDFGPVIYHNTLDGGAGDGVFALMYYSAAAIDFNILQNFTGYGINISSCESCSVSADYNSIANNTGGQYIGVSTWGANNIADEQTFYAPASQDFRLASGATAIDAIPAAITDTVTIDARNLSRPQNIDWDMGAYEMDQTNPANPILDESDPAMGCTLEASAVLTWTMGADNESGVAGYYWVQDDVSDTDPTAGSPFFTELPPAMITLNSGKNYVHIVAADKDGNLAGSILHVGPWNYDTTPPLNPTLLTTSVMTDTCVQDTSTSLSWFVNVDDCGMYGFFYYVDSDPTGSVTTSDTFSASPPTSITLSKGANYLHIRAKDNSHMLADETLTIGPWHVDDELPVNPVMGGVSVITSTCVTDNFVEITWTSPGSDDCGTVQYRWCIDSSPDTDPGSVVTAVVQTSLPTIFTLGDGLNYIHMVAEDDFNSAADILHFGPWLKDTNRPSNPTLDSTTVNVGECTNATYTNLAWTPGADDCALDGYYWIRDGSPSTDPTSAGSFGELPLALTLSGGDNYLHVQAMDEAGQLASGILHIGPWKVDGAEPVNPVLDSTTVMTDTCTTSASTSLTWTAGSDDCALEGYYVLINNEPSTDPEMYGTLVGTLPETLTISPGVDTYLHVIAKDEAGNSSGLPQHYGPWKGDGELPVNPILDSASVSTGTCTVETMTYLTWTPGSDDCEINGYYWIVDSAADSDPKNQGNFGALPSDISFSAGDNYLHVQAQDSAGQLADAILHIGPWKMDDAPPTNPEMTSCCQPISTCLDSTYITITWNAGTDDCGIDGYYWYVDQISDTDPTIDGTYGALPASFNMSVGDNYMHVIAMDSAGRLATEILHLGPWQRDGALPVNPTLAGASVLTGSCVLDDGTYLSWNEGSDDCGLAGYYYIVDSATDTDPSSEGDFGALPTELTFSDGDNWLHVLAKDEAGKTASEILHIGPWRKDVSLPVNPLLTGTTVPTSTCTLASATNLTWTPGSDDCDLDGYWYIIDSNPVADPSIGGVFSDALPESIALPEGQTYLHVLAQDSLGQTPVDPLHIGPWTVDAALPINPVLDSTTVATGTCTTSSLTALTWTPGDDDCSLHGYYHKIDSSPDSDPYADGVFITELPANIGFSNGDNYYHIVAVDSLGQLAEETLHIGPWKKDSALPLNPELTSLDVVTGTCTPETGVNLLWNMGSDDCAIDGYYYIVDDIADTDPSSDGTFDTAPPSNIPLSAGVNYLHVRVKDEAGQLAADTLHIGPWRMDDAPPTLPTLYSNSVLTGVCLLDDSVALGWTDGWDDCDLNGYYWIHNGAPDTDPSISGNYGGLPTEMALESGDNYLHVRSKDSVGRLSDNIMHVGPWKKDGSLPENPELIGSDVVTGACTTAASTALTWTPGTDECKLDGYYWLVTNSPLTAATSGDYGDLPETITLSTGDNYLHVRARDESGQLAGSTAHFGPWRRDDAPPENPRFLSSSVTTDTCTANGIIAIGWAAGSDDCELAGYYWIVDAAPDTDPLAYGTMTETPPVSTPIVEGDNYLHLIAVDTLGNTASQTMHIGPWIRDLTPPANPILGATSVVTDTCTSDAGTTLTWTYGSDNCSDVTYAWIVDENASTNPLDGTPEIDSNPPGNILFDYNTNYLHIVAVDEAGNAADTVLHYGPWTKCDSVTGPDVTNWSLNPFGAGFVLEDPNGVDLSSLQVVLDVQGGYQTDITSQLNLNYSDTTYVTVTYERTKPFAAGSVITTTVYVDDDLGNPTDPNPIVLSGTIRDAMTHELYTGDSIQDALDVAIPGDTVHLNAGEYTISGSNLLIGSRHYGITLMGDGHEDSIIDCGAYGIVMDGVADFTLKGLSIGTTEDQTLLFLQGSSENVLIEGNVFGVTHEARTPLLRIGASGSGNRIVNNIMTSAYNAGTGVYVDGSITELEIVNNTMVDLINGIDCIDSASPLIAFNIIAFNSEGIYADNTFDVHYNCVYGNGADYDSTITHATDINEDPLFVDAAGKDFHLQEISPCVDALESSAAATAGTEFPATDLDGALRPDGSKYDIGCYETWFYDENSPYIESWSYDANLPGGEFGFTIGDDFGVDSSSVILTMTSDQTTYPLVITNTLVVDDSDLTSVIFSYTPEAPWPANAVVTATAVFQDFAGNMGGESVTYTVRDNVVNHVYAGESIQDALDALTAGDSLLVHAGTFTLTDSLMIEERHSGIRISGEGPDSTILTFNGSIGWGVHLNGVKDFTLDGFGIESGDLTQGHILLQYDAENVLIKKNRITSDSSSALDALSISATGTGNRIENNLFVDNQTASIGINVWAAANEVNVSPEIVNNTIVGFRTGVFSSDTSPKIAYNILADGMWGVGRDGASSTLAIYHNNASGNSQANYSGPLSHEGDWNTDPLFVDAANGDYHLDGTSPSVDSIEPSIANVTGVAFPTDDLDNSSRPIGGYYDPGCYETQAALVFTSTPGDAVDENAVYTYQPTVSGAITSYAFADGSNQPAGMTISETTGEIYYNPLYDDEAGTYTVIIEATAADGRSVTQQFTFTVTAVNDPPETPASVEPQPYGAMVNRLFSLEFYSYDEETAALQYSLGSGPDGMEIPVATDGVVEWAPQSGDTGTATFSVLASDGVNSVSSGVLDVTVVPSLGLAPAQGSPAIIVTYSGAAAPVTTTVEIACRIKGGLPPYSVDVIDETIGAVSDLDAGAGTFTFTPLASGRTQLTVTDSLGFTLTSGMFNVHYIEATLLVNGGQVNAGEGATLTVNEPDSDLDGLSFTIPVGSTSSVITPTISQVETGQPYMEERSSPVVEIGPSGTTFAIPASLAFPNNSGLPTDELLVFTYNTELGRWVYVPGAVITGDTVTVPLAHLSLYTLARPTEFTTQLNGGTEVEDYRLISFPAYAADMESMVEILSDPDNLDEYDDAKWRLFGFDPLAQYTEDPEEYYLEGNADGFDDKFPFGPCQAYWVISRYAKEVAARGLHVDSTEDYYTTLQPGWNLIGDPFTTSLYWTKVESSVDGETFYRQDSASADNPLKDRNLFYYEPDTRKADPDGYVETTVMQPYVGYWVKNDTGAPLVVKLPVSAFIYAVVGKGDADEEPGLLSKAARKISRMIDRVAWAVSDEDRPPSPPGSSGSNAGSGSNSIGVADGGGGGGCFVDAARPAKPCGSGAMTLAALLFGLAALKLFGQAKKN
ncbi:Ig family protein [Desulfatibacillum aliphaticivorans]|uniref:Ig family protein n=2 Tax=Desulfatibacillum aliphaticivorans TaxID=218208 RepID=B8FK54_DESAL|nr:Ig family protein [Desulfatibacillum aliphaticivorans]